LHKVHSNSKLVSVQLAFRVDVRKIPNLSKHFFRQFSVTEERHCLLSGDKAAIYPIERRKDLVKSALVGRGN
jgi:hypothetical protein